MFVFEYFHCYANDGNIYKDVTKLKLRSIKTVGMILYLFGYNTGFPRLCYIIIKSYIQMFLIIMEFSKITIGWFYYTN